jgi:hypothetical protein
MAEGPQYLKVDAQPEPEEDSGTARYYSNYAALTITPEEFVLRFGERDLKDANKVREAARVYLNLHHAKRLVIAMTRSLKAYEQTFGEIVADPVASLDAETKKKFGIPE